MSERSDLLNGETINTNKKESLNGDFPLIIRGLSKRYTFKKEVTLDDISMSVQKGNCICIVGANGTGKTTLFNIITGNIPYTKGDVSIKGKIGYSSEISINFQWLTLRQYIEYFSGLTGNTNDFKNYIKMLHMDGVADKKIRNFSKGMKRKVDLIRMLVSEPDVFLMDEPFDGLDPVASKELIQLVNTLKKSGKSVLVSSHDMSYVEQIADRVFLLKDGEIEDMEEYKSAYIIKFIDTEGKADEALKELKKIEIEKRNDLCTVQAQNAEIRDKVIDLLRKKELKIIEQRAKSLEEIYLEKFSE